MVNAAGPRLRVPHFVELKRDGPDAVGLPANVDRAAVNIDCAGNGCVCVYRHRANAIRPSGQARVPDSNRDGSSTGFKASAPAESSDPPERVRRRVNSEGVVRGRRTRNVRLSPPSGPPGGLLTAEPQPRTRFRTAIEGRWVFHAEVAAREIGNVTLAEALDLVILYTEHEPAKFEKAALRWHARFVSERNPSLLKAQIALAALSDLRSKSEPAIRLLGELAALS